MAELPEQFKCTVTNWDYIYRLCRDVADEVKASNYEPDVIVALARGGWFAGRVLCDFLGLDDLTSLKVEHYVGTAQKTGEPEIRYPMPEGSVEGKRVLIIDDIADTGQSLQHAYEYVEERAPADIRTGTLQLMQESEFEPDYIGERLDEWAWIVYPWNFIEDMTELIEGVIEKDGAETVTTAEIRRLLTEYHQIERIQLEIAQPDRLKEVLEEMVRRDLLARADEDRWRLIA
ncbi:MAG: phosphoribosyltransferase [Halobacteriales archaeon]|nr:phosphoribosyltransferase [Halobacteriales archaeon]